ncbi:hypothetical protein [Sporosarcina luteola]|uniref:hypothetical protein n=1 Tax=Sporosarcina luteola TaxID=582850 RepID=UPI003342B3B8
MWIQRIIDTTRGNFEIYERGQGEPLAVTHLYSEYDERGNAFANPFTDQYHVTSSTCVERVNRLVRNQYY